MTRIPKKFRESAYMSADGQLAWFRDEALELVAWMAEGELAPSVVEAWMVFTEPPFAGTHTPIIYHDAENSSYHRWQLEGDFSSADGTWEGFHERAVHDAAAFIREGHAETRVHESYRGTIRYHLEWRGPEATE